MASLITDIGNAKLLVASPLNPVKIKSVVVGTGSAPFDSSIMSLQQQVWIGNASDPQKTLNNSLKFTTIIPSNVGSWTIQEWGLIDIEGDLIAYGQLDEGIYKQLGVMSIEPNFYIKLSSESETELVVTDSINFDHNALTNRNAVDSHPISAISKLQEELDSKVSLNGDQNISGLKKFNNGLQSPTINNGNAGLELTDNTVVLSAGGDSQLTGLEIDSLNRQILVNGQLVGDGSGLDRASTTDAGVTVLNNTLTSTSNTQALTAAQGKVLNEKIENIPVYSLPTASTTTKGGVKVGTGLSVANEVLSVSLNNTLTSTSNTQALTAAQGKVLNDQALGVGQTTQNLTSSRTQGVTYTNSTGRAIEVSIGVRVSTSGTSSLLRDGVSVGSVYGDVGSGGSVQGQLSAIIPNGSSYILNGGTIQTWTELR